MANPDLETPEFIERLRAGDRAAFALVVKHYHPRLLGAARTLLQPADAEEAVQDGWIAAHRALPKFEGRSALLTRDELQHCLESHITAMPDNQRLALQLRDIQGLDFDDICNIMDVSASNVRVLVHRARARLFEMVDRFQETGEC